MSIYEWNENLSLEEQKNGAYWERNMLALMLSTYNNVVEIEDGHKPQSGWYYDTDNNWKGWKRVISIKNGTITYHIPDDFDVGNLPQIEPNWDGHSTRDKYLQIMKMCGCKVQEVQE